MDFPLWIASAISMPLVCFGQSVSVGAIGGAMVSNNLGSQWLSSVSTRYTFGPELDISLPFGLGIEFDALYRHEGYQETFTGGYTQQFATSWEFPVLLKKAISVPILQPLLEGGWVPRKLQGNSYYSNSTTSQGVVIGGGVQVGLGRLKLSPVLRYTHWYNSPTLLVIPNGPSPQLTANQVDILLGVGWKIRSAASR